jgi:hypothetical protein
MKTSLAMFTVLSGAFSLVGCAISKVYFVRNPTVSAKLVQTWRLDDFVREIENHEKELEKSNSSTGTALVLAPFFSIPFRVEELKELKSRAEKGDLVLWYSDRWLDLDISYICLQRAGKIIWTFKHVEQRQETLAFNKFPLPTPGSDTPAAGTNVTPPGAGDL